MKIASTLACTLILIVIVSTAQAAPVIGFYDSEFSGEILEGRWSESYVGGGAGQLGNTIHAASWDGSVLGGQWLLAGPAIDAAPSILSDTRNGGTGSVTYLTTYGNGNMTLALTGPWGGAGDVADYAVSIGDYRHTTVNTYVMDSLVASTTIVEMMGTFDDYAGYELNFVVAVAIPAGEGSTIAADYPAWLPSSANSGAWGVAQKIRTEIIPEPATAALLGVGFAMVAVRRRRRNR